SCMKALNDRGLANASALNLRASVADFNESRRLAKELNDPRYLSQPLPRICAPLIALGKFDDAEEAVAEACLETSRTQDWGDHSIALAYRVSLANFRGDFAAVEWNAARGLAIARRSHYPWGAAVILPTLAFSRCLRGAFDEADDAIEAMVEPGSITDEPGAAIRAVGYVYRVLIRCLSGAVEQARESVPQMLSLARSTAGRDLESVAGYCALAEIAHRTGHAKGALGQYDALQFARTQEALFCPSWGFLIPRVMGVITADNGMWDESEQHFKEALEAGEKVGARTELGRTYLDYASMLTQRKSGEDRETAAVYLGKAAQLLEDIGVRLVSDEA